MKHEKDAKRQEVLVLGAFRYARASGLLTDAEGGIVRMRRQSEEVLSVLARDPGEIVSKEGLVEAVWPGIATTDDSLVQCIADIRRTLGREVVETFPKKGYRLCPGPDAAPATRLVARWHWFVLAAGGLALLAALAVFVPSRTLVEPGGPIVPPVVEPDRTLAVLPFANLSGDPALRYFSDGLSEDLTTELSKVERRPGICPRVRQHRDHLRA